MLGRSLGTRLDRCNIYMYVLTHVVVIKLLEYCRKQKEKKKLARGLGTELSAYTK